VIFFYIGNRYSIIYIKCVIYVEKNAFNLFYNAFWLILYVFFFYNMLNQTDFLIIKPVFVYAAG